jgi:hypothetical protein
MRGQRAQEQEQERQAARRGIRRMLGRGERERGAAGRCRLLRQRVDGSLRWHCQRRGKGGSLLPGAAAAAAAGEDKAGTRSLREGTAVRGLPVRRCWEQGAGCAEGQRGQQCSSAASPGRGRMPAGASWSGAVWPPLAAW